MSESIPAGAMPRVGPYELLRRIGVGGMATVYLARKHGEAGFTRIYALKVMHRHLATQRELVTMLMDEARLAARIQHPNVVSIVDLGHADDHYYVAMDYVDGVALDRLLARKPSFRPASMLVPIAMDALLGLASSHELVGPDGRSLDLVHRDVTPGNVLVGVDGMARITDFGTAKARARATKTMPGVVKGKVGYVAPEVALGKPFDARADLFSMGVLLWNALTGERLYDTDDIAKNIQQLVSTEPPPPSLVGLGPPEVFDEPILTALSRDPVTRFANAREMYEALEDALAQFGGEPPRRQIGEWVETSFARLLQRRRELADPDVHIVPVRPSGPDEDSTVPFRTVPAESEELDGVDDPLDPVESSVRERPTARPPAPAQRTPLPSPAPAPAEDAPEEDAAPTRGRRVLIVATILMGMFALGLASGVLALYLIR